MQQTQQQQAEPQTHCDAVRRTIGGRDALKDEFPYVVRLEIVMTKKYLSKEKLSYYQFCTGTAIASEWIITAAHCYKEEYLKSTNRTMVARYNSYFPKEMGEISPILAFFAHPRYAQIDLTKEYDLCLLRSKNIIVSQYAKISAVIHNALVGHEVYILGFGRTNASELEKPLQVLKGMLNYCLKNDIPAATVMCVVPLCGAAATVCAGDSGSPIVHPSGIIGVTSRAADICNEFTTSLKRTPETSTSIAAMFSCGLDWILNVISNKIIHING